jgi:PPOX class probable F420-dependent enzyme
MAMFELSDDVRALLEGANIAHVATVLPDGGPHSAPVWIGTEGDRIAFLTSPGSRKARNLQHDPRVAISITDREQGYTIQPYPERTDRVVFLVAPEHAMARAFG